MTIYRNGIASPVVSLILFEAKAERFPAGAREDAASLASRFAEEVARSGGWAAIPGDPGLGIELDLDFVRHYEIDG